MLYSSMTDELSKIAERDNKAWLRKIRQVAASREGNTPIALMKQANPFMKQLPKALKAAKTKVLGRASAQMSKGVAGGAKGGYRRVKPPKPKAKPSPLSLNDPWFK